MITKNLSSFLNHISYVRGDNLRYLCFVKRHDIVLVQYEYGLLPVRYCS